MTTNKIFLLGGADLEMLEIKKILQKNECLFYDRGLSWENASLAQYREVLSLWSEKINVVIYGIELVEGKEDVVPSNYIRIDHHNDFNNKPSSIEQVAEILGVKLNSFQKNVAANDSGYIPALKTRGATQDEIDHIRLLDRQSQGVTEQDEQLAEKAIANKVRIVDLCIVESETSCFSPITDRLFPSNNLLIYTSDEMVYYGKHKSDLVDFFQKNIKEGTVFYGGDENGYLGFVKGVYTRQEIIELKDTIIELLTHTK